MTKSSRIFPYGDDSGMTLRQHYAGLAMAAQLTAMGKNGELNYSENIIAKRAWALADAMIRQEKQI